MCALFSYFHWLTMVAILQLKASKHFVYFVSIAVVTFTLLNILYLMYYIYLLLHHLLFTIIIFIKHYLYFCKIRSDINLSQYRSSNERYRDMQLMSLCRMCRDIVLSRYSSVTGNTITGVC